MNRRNLIDVVKKSYVLRSQGLQLGKNRWKRSVSTPSCGIGLGDPHEGVLTERWPST